MKTRSFLVALSTLALAGTAFAGGTTYNGTGGFVADNTEVDFTLDVADSYAIGDVTASVHMTATWVGDVSVSLISPSGTEVSLVHRIGVIDGVGVGDSSDYGGTYNFGDDFGGDIWAEADAAGGGDIVAEGDYFATGGNGDVSLLSAFDGEDVNGTWTLRVSDNAAGDDTTIGDWSITVEAIPAPAAMALLGVAGLAGTRRRRA